jgi:predicted DNA-binding transcriptional regulator YafY
MLKVIKADFGQEFPDEEYCLDWLKRQLYPEGVRCSICKKVTKHHKVSKRRCYVCDKCGNHFYPTAGTIFHKSTTPLRTWFSVINRLSTSKSKNSAKEIQKEYALTYKTACRMVQKSEEFLKANSLLTSQKTKFDKTDVDKANQKSDNKEASQSSEFYQEETSGDFSQKKDRTARLLKLQMLLCQHSQGLSIFEIASRCSTSKRTIYRDLRTLESELGVPIWEEGSKRGIAEGYFLPPITLTPAEATIVFLAARLIQNYSYLNIPSLTSTFMKLNTIVPQPLRKEIRQTLEYLEKQPQDARKINNFNKLIRAWLTQHKVKMLCQYIDEEKPVERIIDPYFIEPSIIGGSSYIIAYCNLRKTICAFKLERIFGEVEVESETFTVPSDFNAVDYLGSAWGIQTDKEAQIVKLHFKPRISRVIAEFNLHPTQHNEFQKDGSLIMTLKVRDDIHFRNLIMAWADEVEVIEPETLRTQIRGIAKSLLKIYPEPEPDASQVAEPA